MQRFNVPGSNKGFTLLETVTVVAMIGIVSAIAAPSFLSMYSRSKINSATAEVQGVLQEAQRQSIRTSKSCTVSVGTTSVTGNCLVSGNLSLNGVTADSSLSSFQFNHKGLVLDSSAQPFTNPLTLVITANNSNLKRCLILTSPLGLIRTGTYSNSASGTPSATNCTVQNR